MRAVVVLFAAALFFQWLSSFPAMGSAPSDVVECECYEFYVPSSKFKIYIVCKDAILQPGKQLVIPDFQDHIKCIFFENNILPVIPIETFITNPTFTHLVLTHNAVKTLLPGLFAPLNQLEELQLQDNNIADISTGIFNNLANLTLLDLSNNDIVNLEPGCFTGLENLKTLNLNGNKIYNLDRKIFFCLDNLEILNLSHNNLALSEPSFVIELLGENLRKLLINNNLFEDFPILLTGEVNNLEILDASFNALTKLDMESIPVSKIANFSNNQIFVISGFPETYNTSVKDLDNLEINIEIKGEVNYFYLSWNKLTVLNISAFNDPEAMIELDISYNFINVIEDNVFHAFPNLQILKLNNNNLSYLGVDCFVGLDSLDFLSLSHNSLSILDEGVFNGLSNLTTLHLDNNKLVYMHKDVYWGLLNLRFLSLNNNLLPYLDVSLLLVYLPNLQALFLSNNRWDCNTLMVNTEEFRVHSVELVRDYHFHTFKAFELACDNLQLQVYLHNNENETVVEFMHKIIRDLVLVLILTIDLILGLFCMRYLRFLLRRSEIKLRKYETLYKGRTRNSTHTYRIIIR